MSKTRYGHSGAGGGHQDQPERKDEGWERRQGGPESREPGRRGEPRPADDEATRTPPPPGTNTQGELAGIGQAAERVAAEIPEHERPVPEASTTPGVETVTEASTSTRRSDLEGAGTDQPRRMGGPLGPDEDEPHLPEGAQSADTRGTGAGGFDRGVDASRVGSVHQGTRPEASD